MLMVTQLLFCHALHIHRNFLHMNISSIYNLTVTETNRRIHHIRQRRVSASHSGFYDNPVHNDTSRVPSVNYLSHLYTNGPQPSSVSSLPASGKFPDFAFTAIFQNLIKSDKWVVFATKLAVFLFTLAHHT